MASRLEAMDAQRYNFAKIQSRSELSMMTEATSGHNDVAQFDIPAPRINLAMDAQRFDISKSRKHAIFYVVDEESSMSTTCSLHHATTPFNSPSASDTESDSASSNEEASTASPLTGVSSASFTLEDSTATHYTGDGASKAAVENTTTCTIIRPMARSSIVEFFSRPSSPVSRPSSPVSRPSSPASRPSSPIIFSTLNCFGSTDTFEDEVDYIQNQRANELAGMANVQVFVTRKQTTYHEESWRQSVQAILYGNRVEAESFAVVSRGD